MLACVLVAVIVAVAFGRAVLITGQQANGAVTEQAQSLSRTVVGVSAGVGMGRQAVPRLQDPREGSNRMQVLKIEKVICGVLRCDSNLNAWCHRFGR